MLFRSEMPEGLFCVSHGRLLKSKNGYFYKAFGMCPCFRKSFFRSCVLGDARVFVIKKLDNGMISYYTAGCDGMKSY